MVDPTVFGVLSILMLVVLIGAGAGVGAAMGTVGLVGMYILGGMPLVGSTVKTLPYEVVSEYAFIVIPMFVLMGAFASAAGITTELYKAAYRWLSGVRGSLYMATTLGSAGFAAVSGSTMVNAAVFTRIALPEMIRFRYNRGIGAGCIAAAGTFAALIPPSIAMVLVAILSEESIGALLVAGIIPGILTAVVYMVGIWFMMRIRPQWAPERPEAFSRKQKLDSLKDTWPMLLLITLVLGGIYSGAVFPSSAGALGAIGALLIGLIRRRLGREAFWNALVRSAASTAVLFLIVIGGLVFSRMLVYSGFIYDLADLVTDVGLTPFAFMIAVLLMYFLLGMFIDTISMLVVTVPFVFPIVNSLGIDAIWFAVILVKMVEIAAISPPVGLNLYAVLSAAEGQVTPMELFRGVVPFLCLELIVLLLLFVFPEVVTWLPERMFRS